MTGLPFIMGQYKAIPKRGISEETCKRLGYQIGTVPSDYPAKPGSTMYSMKGQTVHIENYYDDDDHLCGQKLRTKDKKFVSIGDVSGKLFGKRASPAGGKVLVVTEGAIDSLSYGEVRKDWPVVSVPNGADSAAKAIKENLTYLETFEKVILAFDNDQSGKEGLKACRGLMSPGRSYEAALSPEYKDFNEALLDGDFKAILHAVFQATEYRPDGIVSIDELMEDALTPIEFGLPWFIPDLTALTYGRRFREIYALGGPTGGGKTDIFTEQANYDVNVLKRPIGMLYLEQKPAETAKRLAGKAGSKRFHVPDAGWTNEELKQSLQGFLGMVHFYDSFGQTDWEEVKSAIRHMNVSSGVRIFYLDHLTAMANTADEANSISQIMKEMAGLADELNIIIHFISHLATPEGKPHEEGGRVTIRHFKGSRSIGFWSHFMFGIERDQQAEDPTERQRTTFRCLKDRYTGTATGQVIFLGYDPQTGRIVLPDALSWGPKENSKDEDF